MKYIVTAALLLNAASAYSQMRQVKLAFAGTGGASPIDLKQADAHTGEENVEGNGTLGRFTFRGVRTGTSVPQSSSSCMGPTQVYFPSVAGGGIFRFRDGSLLTVRLMQGGDCVDFAAGEAQCTLMLQITGGTGRFKGASGVLTYSETAKPALADGSGNPVLFTESGEITGMVSGVGGQDSEEAQE
jgi:hypothetical protein